MELSLPFKVIFENSVSEVSSLIISFYNINHCFRIIIIDEGRDRSKEHKITSDRHEES